MEAVLAHAQAPVESHTETAARGLIEFWTRACDEFMDNQRRNLIEREPSPELLNRHKKDLNFMLRMTLLLQSQVLDPEFPAKQCRLAVSGRLLQFEESLKLFETHLTDEQSDAILKQAFPE